MAYRAERKWYFSLKLSFLNFWGDFDPDNNFFTHFFKKYWQNVSVVHPSQADTIIYTVFGREHLLYNHCKKIFYTGENTRPNYNECHASLTFDFEDYGGKNIRLPLWMLYIDWFNVGSYGNPSGLVPIEKVNNNILYRKPKTKFCSIVQGHLRNKRQETMDLLSKYKQVDGYGKPWGNWTYGEHLKYDVISNYKFNICFENEVHGGYITEKLLHARVAGCIPLYYGPRAVEQDFNPNCFVNLLKYNSVEDFVNKAIEIDTNETLYNEYRNQPLFNTPPTLDEYYNKIKTII